MRHIVNALLMRERAVLLALRAPHRHAYPDRWSFPGGHVEANETLDEALIRELREEIGITPTQYLALKTIPDPNAPAADPVTYHMYAVMAWDGGEPTMTGDEHTALGWFAPNEAASLAGLALEEYRSLLHGLTGA
jgi:mutator protein MutT